MLLNGRDNPENSPFPLGDLQPHLIHGSLNFPGPIRVFNPNGISIGSAVFVWVPNQNAMLYNALSTWQQTPKIAHSPWDFVTLPEQNHGYLITMSRTEPRPWAICIKKFGKDYACGSGDMLVDRQTDTNTHRDALITILCHRSHRLSNNTNNNNK